MSKKLIINADDYGNSPAVSEGIRHAYLNGIVTSTTAMMNIPGAADQVRDAIVACPGLGMGVHLVLSEGRPVLPPKELESITAGEPYFPDPDALLERLDSVDFEEVEREWTAQVELFIAAAGRAPDHLDAHHHMAYMHPEFFRILLDLAKRYACGIRTAFLVENEADPNNSPVENQGNLAVLKKMLAESKVPHPDYFQHSIYDEEDFPTALMQVLAALPEGVTELMCHPGLVDEALMSLSTYNLQREKELSTLTEPGLKDLLLSRGVKLISFGEL
jgi:chitin disaccharide deacetylase